MQSLYKSPTTICAGLVRPFDSCANATTVVRLIPKIVSTPHRRAWRERAVLIFFELGIEIYPFECQVRAGLRLRFGPDYVLIMLRESVECIT